MAGRVEGAAGSGVGRSSTANVPLRAASHSRQSTAPESPRRLDAEERPAVALWCPPSLTPTVLGGAGAAEFVLARGREAQYERSRPVTPVPDISLAEVLAEVLGRTASTGATSSATSSATAPPPPATAEPATVPPAAADASAPPTVRPTVPLIYHAGPIESWGEALGGEAARLYSNPNLKPNPDPDPNPDSNPDPDSNPGPNLSLTPNLTSALTRRRGSTRRFKWTTRQRVCPSGRPHRSTCGSVRGRGGLG